MRECISAWHQQLQHLKLVKVHNFVDVKTMVKQMCQKHLNNLRTWFVLVMSLHVMRTVLTVIVILFFSF